MSADAGLFVGCVTGLEDGLVSGDTPGLFVGSALGNDDGIIVGHATGPEDEMFVGNSSGPCVGSTVGLVVRTLWALRRVGTWGPKTSAEKS